MRRKHFFNTDAGIKRLCLFLVSFGLPAPSVHQYFSAFGHQRRFVLLTGHHLIQLTALRIGWKNLRTARAELKQVAV